MRTVSLSSFLVLCCSLAATVSLPARGQGRGAGAATDPKRPFKIVNLKVAVTLDLLDAPGADVYCQEPARFAGQFGIQTAFFPFTVEATFQTSVAFELYAAAWWPFLHVGSGWLAASAGLFGRTSLQEVPDGVDACGSWTETGMYENFGIGASLEYLVLDGNLGFLVDVRQTVLSPASTFVTLGVDVSPLLVRVLRRY